MSEKISLMDEIINNKTNCFSSYNEIKTSKRKFELNY